MEFWAPWIGKKTTKSAMVLNTEFKKIHTSKVPSENAELAVTENDLLNDLLKQPVCVPPHTSPPPSSKTGLEMAKYLFSSCRMKWCKNYAKSVDYTWEEQGWTSYSG